ncbi:MAG TPA: DUF3376 domain-containing protein [Solirubrobacterales bacterium]|nr:DUF3376 domain-containing protein [Solirubrobacterales bacterium]
MAPQTESVPAVGAEDLEPEKEELRLALALNGGVSLAVWMGGCAVELDRARRADDEEDAGAPIYEALCECFGRRVVIDILTGTSAGGINGALLGAAIATRGKLDADLVRNSWIELGDLGQILQDPNADAPTALMDGEKFHAELLGVFEKLLESGSGVADPPPSLDVTMTDVIGVERRFRDTWGSELIAREHRPRFKFRRPEHFSPEALAAAARTSASFPIAFDPWRVEGNPKVLAGLPNPTYGMDGGLLNNAPIREALELIPSRFAAAAVRRYVCYINADPTPSSDATIGPEPSLAEVGGYIVTLPRRAPLVDHLYAIRDAVERPKRLGGIQGELVTLDLDQLQAVAKALFDAYRRRRTLESLEELLTEPGDANAMFDLLREVDGSLPWIPGQDKWDELGAETENPEQARETDCCEDSATPDEPPLTWEWGTRPAQRALHLLLDLLRPAIACADSALRGKLLKARLEIQLQIKALDSTHLDVTGGAGIGNPSRFDPELAAEIVNKAAAKAVVQARGTRATVLAGAAVFRKLLEDETVGELRCFENLAEALFGDPGKPEPERQRFFLRRVLSIEVVRRALSAEADIESAEPLNFVQLTPDAPSPIFTADPLRQRGPATAQEKLTGVGLGHFAGFYRRSWRANDFMWGRLDAAARIVDLLLDDPSAHVGIGAEEDPKPQAKTRADNLAGALVGAAATEDAWLLEELLPPQPEDDKRKPLPDRLAEVIEAELVAAKPGETNGLPLTRALFQRMAQLEVLREELSHLRKESKQDRKLGAAAKSLKLGGKHPVGTRSQIEDVRAIYREGSSLPKKLDDEGEVVSNLGLQTITHAGFVGLAAIRSTGVPMGKFLGLVRPPLLSVAGTVAARWIDRAAAALGYWAAAIFIASQLASATPGATPPLQTIFSLATLVGVVAVLTMIGIVLVPGLRLRKGVAPVRNGFYAAALIAAGGGVAVGWALATEFNVEDVILAPGAQEPSFWPLFLPLLVLGLSSVFHLPGVRGLDIVEKLIEEVRKKPKLTRYAMPAFTIVAFGLLGVASGKILLDHFDDDTRRTVTALTALIAAPIAAGFAVSIWKFHRWWKGWRNWDFWPFKRAEAAGLDPTKPPPTA